MKAPALLLLGALLWSLATHAALGAAEVVPSAGTPQFVVEVTAMGSQLSLDALEERTVALLKDDAVTMHFHVSEGFRPRDVLAANEGTALAHIWLDARDPKRAVLYVVDPAHERFLVRVIPLENGYDEIACESVGTIIESSVEALIVGATLGVSREKAEEQVSVLERAAADAPDSQDGPAARTANQKLEVPQQNPSKNRPRLHFAVDASYRTQLWSGDPFVMHGPELGARLLQPGHGLSAAAFITIGYYLAGRWEKEGIGAHFQGPFARGGPGIRYGFNSKWNTSAMATVGLDWLNVAPTTSDELASPREDLSVLSVPVGFQLEVEWRFAPSFGFWLSLGAEGDLLGNHFDVVVNGESEPLLEPWPLQPMSRLGVRFFP